MNQPRYDVIGHGYSTRRKEDPFIVNRIAGNSRTVINVGAGAGSYEPQSNFSCGKTIREILRFAQNAVRTTLDSQSVVILSEAKNLIFPGWLRHYLV